LAQKGFNIFIVSRSEAKLGVVAKEIKAEISDPKFEVKTFPLDFAKADQRDYNRLRAVLHDVDVHILINNVGMGHVHPQYFYEENEDIMEAMIKVNALAAIKMTKLIIPQMVTRASGMILNIGSFAGSSPTPFLQGTHDDDNEIHLSHHIAIVYSGTKGFLSNWSISLGAELKEKGIHVELLNTYFVATNLSKIKRTSWLRPSPASFVAAALKSVGYDLFNTPFPSQDIYYNLMKLLPPSILLKITTDAMAAGRSKALARQSSKSD
jgi:17beta-estradiol 17-dehydrogenase / very-long-chain 3-oxoacyl-CoA reductase